MKSIFISILAVLLFVGIAQATGIPGVTSPYDQPIVWTEDVYNGSGSEIASGLAVQWDYDTSNVDNNWNDDMCPWVKKTDADGDIWTAGVTLFNKSIADGSVGQIIIKGPALVMYETAPTVNTLCEASSAGNIQDHDGNAVDECTLGRTIKSQATQQGYTSGSVAIVDIGPVCYDKD